MLAYILESGGSNWCHHKKAILKLFYIKKSPANTGNCLPELISSNQTAYVKNRCIKESGRLTSEVIKMCDILDIPGYLITVDTEMFDSLKHWRRLILYIMIFY